MRRIAILMGSTSTSNLGPRVAAFRHALEQLGWIEGRNVRIDVRWGANDRERVAAHARELVSLQPDVILVGPTNALLPLKRETQSIPIVFVQVSDPLGQGIVASVARPGHNLTGFSNLEFSLIGKYLQLLKEIAPGIARVGVMIHVSNAVSASWFRMFKTVAPTFAVEPVDLPVRDRGEIESGIDALARQPNSCLVVPGDSYIENPDRRTLIVAQTASRRLPALYTFRGFVREGGLMSYGIDQVEQYRGAASYVDRILKGESPADLPVQAPTKFELAINLRTAAALGLTVPLTLHASADEVIE
jgi:putative ABC transport system substrate-binding protein